VPLASNAILEYPLVYLTGHMPFRFSEAERRNARRLVERGGMIFIDDHNHDIGGVFHKTAMEEITRTFSQPKDLPNDHQIYRCFFKFDDGPPDPQREHAPVRRRRLFEREAIDFCLPPRGFVQPAIERVQINGHIPALFHGRNRADVPWVLGQGRGGKSLTVFAGGRMRSDSGLWRPAQGNEEEAAGLLDAYLERARGRA